MQIIANSHFLWVPIVTCSLPEILVAIEVTQRHWINSPSYSISISFNLHYTPIRQEFLLHITDKESTLGGLMKSAKVQWLLSESIRIWPRSVWFSSSRSFHYLLLAPNTAAFFKILLNAGLRCWEHLRDHLDICICCHVK